MKRYGINSYENVSLKRPNKGFKYLKKNFCFDDRFLWLSDPYEIVGFVRILKLI